MELYEMKYFCAVYESRSFSSASQAVHISQPALSQCIKRLEKEIGAQCFLRDTRNLKPTQFGDLIYNYCKQILNLKDSMDGALYEMTNSDKIEIKVGMSPFYCKHYLPAIIQKMKEQYPNIRLKIAEIISEQQEILLKNGELDFCCIPQDPEIEGLSYETICMEEILLAIPSDSPLANLAISATPLSYLNIQLLDGQKIVKLKDVQKISKLLNPLFNSMNITFDTAYETLDWDTVNVMIANGVGIGFIPDILYRHSDDNKCPKFFRVTNTGFLRRYSIAYNKNKVFSPLERCIVMLFKKTICDYREELISW